MAGPAVSYRREAGPGGDRQSADPSSARFGAAQLLLREFAYLIVLPSVAFAPGRRGRRDLRRRRRADRTREFRSGAGWPRILFL